MNRIGMALLAAMVVWVFYVAHKADKAHEALVSERDALQAQVAQLKARDTTFAASAWIRIDTVSYDSPVYALKPQYVRLYIQASKDEISSITWTLCQDTLAIKESR